MNKKILTAITPNSLILSAGHRSAVVPLLESEQSQQVNLIEIRDSIVVSPNCSKTIKATIVFNKAEDDADFCLTELNDLKETRNRDFYTENALKSLNKVKYSLSNIRFSDENYPEFLCTVRNNSLDELHLQKDDIIASLSIKKIKVQKKEEIKGPESPSSLDLDETVKPPKDLSLDPQIAETMDEKILEENVGCGCGKVSPFYCTIRNR